jgi:hypothetical protein
LIFDKFKTGAVKSHKELLKLLDENPFLDYASNYWGNHIAAANQVELNDLLSDFLYLSGAQNLLIQVFLLCYDSPFQKCSGITTPLHALSIFNLLKIAKSMPKVHLMKTRHDRYGNLPLDYAVHYQGREICNWLLETTDNILILETFSAGRYLAIYGAVLNDWG